MDQVANKCVRSAGPPFNSHGRKAVDRSGKVLMSGEGAALIPNVPFVVLNPVTIKQFNKFALKISPAMMLCLMIDVSHNIRFCRFAHTKRAITFLPRKPSSRAKVLMNPAR